MKVDKMLDFLIQGYTFAEEGNVLYIKETKTKQ